MTKTDRILEIIQQVADEFQVFKSRGPGEGNRVTNQAVAAINDLTAKEMGQKVTQRALGSNANQSVDFYVEEEATVIEVEFSLSNPYPCLEKDAFKVLLAKDEGCSIETLVLVGDPGCKKRLSAPAPRAISEWIQRRHDISVRVVELSGAPVSKPGKAATA
jgi:hypothetical protein